MTIHAIADSSRVFLAFSSFAVPTFNLEQFASTFASKCVSVNAARKRLARSEAAEDPEGVHVVNPFVLMPSSAIEPFLMGI